MVKELVWAQVEIKLRLPSKEAHDRVAAELAGSFREEHAQENFFFDGGERELSSQRSVLRCRFYNHDKRAIVTLKVGHGVFFGTRRLKTAHSWPATLALPMWRHCMSALQRMLRWLHMQMSCFSRCFSSAMH